MSQLHSEEAAIERDTPGDDATSRQVWSEMVGPLLSGARARGVADTFELMGIAAVLIDRTGGVLHASGRAVRILSPNVRIVEGHLVGCDAVANAALQGLMAEALDAKGSSGQPSTRFHDAEGRVRLFVRAVEFPGHISDDMQLVRSILIVNEIEF